MFLIRGLALLTAVFEFFGYSLAGGNEPLVLLAIACPVLLAVLPVVPNQRAIRWVALSAATTHLSILGYGAWDLWVSGDGLQIKWLSLSWVLVVIGVFSPTALAWNHFRQRDEPNRVTWN
jgi:hypothetical protein